MNLLNHTITQRIAVLLFAFGMTPTTGYSQWVDPTNGVVVEPSASIWQFMRYGNTPVSLYTGSMDVSIPIYNYEDYEFNIPIALKYAFTGQKPNEPDGSFGLGWVLSTGGSITRQINHQPDDWDRNGIYGFLRIYNYKREVPLLNSTSLCVNNSTDLYFLMDQDKIETEPDIFSFNFMGHSGKFIFWANKQIVVFDTDQPKGMYKIEPVMQNTKFYGFRIKTEDGYLYTFGCDSKLDVNDDILYHNYSIGSDDAIYNGPQVAWPLVSIKSPSGRTVSFEYERADEYSKTAQPSSYLVESTLPSSNKPWTHLVQMNIQQQKSLYLKSIALPGRFAVDFTYTDYNSIFNYNGYGARDKMRVDGILDSVVVTNLANYSKIRSIDYGYKFGKPNPIPLLSRVSISDIGHYDLAYHKEMEREWAPYKGTSAIDHWGYSNGYSLGDNLSQYFPESTVQDQEETIKSKQRDPYFNYAVCGALQFIYYPTRGKTEFVYEQNDYSAAVVKSGLDGGNPRTVHYTSNRNAGGIRIKQIIDYDYNPQHGLWTKMRTRTYGYEVKGKSTGILLKSPKYRTKEIEGTSSSARPSMFTASSDLLDCIDTDHHIEYQVITETNQDGSYCKYVYSTYSAPVSGVGRAIPDAVYPASSSHGGVIGDMYKYFYMRPGSRKSSRGKLLSKTLYQAKQDRDDPDVSTYSEDFQYDIPSDWLYGIKPTLNYWYEYKIFTGNCALTSSSQTTYLDDKPMQHSTSYQYDLRTGFITKIDQTDAAGKIIRQNLFYATNSGVPEYDTPLPSRTQLQVKLPGDDDFKTIEINRYIYQGIPMESSWVIPRLIEHWKTHLDKPKTYVSTAEQDADMVLEQKLIPSVSRILERKDRAGTVTSYLYGDNSCELLAIIKNVSYYDAISAIQNSNTIGNYALSSVDEATLRNIPGASVATYSYKPLAGLSSATAPSGSKQMYYYNSSRRLSTVMSGAYGLTGSHLDNAYKYQLAYFIE